MCREERLALYHALAADSAAVSASLTHIDARNASATLDADRRMILEAIEGTMGFDAFNRVLRREMVRCLAALSARAIASKSHQDGLARGQGACAPRRGGSPPIWGSGRIQRGRARTDSESLGAKGSTQAGASRAWRAGRYTVGMGCNSGEIPEEEGEVDTAPVPLAASAPLMPCE